MAAKPIISDPAIVQERCCCHVRRTSLKAARNVSQLKGRSTRESKLGLNPEPNRQSRIHEFLPRSGDPVFYLDFVAQKVIQMMNHTISRKCVEIIERCIILFISINRIYCMNFYKIRELCT